MLTDDRLRVAVGADERAIMQAHVPWTRLVADVERPIAAARMTPLLAARAPTTAIGSC